MPSHTAQSALIKLYSSKKTPWEWPVWQDLTGVQHGLFPDEDDKLPRGWTRKNAVDVQSYFRAYDLLPSEDKKIAFAVNSKGSSTYPGREFWNSWVAKQWSNWGIHTIVIDELTEADVHPLHILIREDDIDAAWPCSDSYIPMILDSLALKLFGEEAFPDGVTVLKTDLRRCVQIIAQRSWNTVRTQVRTIKNRPKEIEATALAAFEGERFIHSSFRVSC